MKSASGIGGRVVAAIQVVRASTITGNGADAPIVSAEMQWFGWGKCRRTCALDNRYKDHRPTLGGRHIQCRWWMIVWLYQERGIFKSQMSFRAPGRVRVNRNKSFIG